MAGIAIASMLTNIRLADQKLWQLARANLSERRPYPLKASRSTQLSPDRFIRSYTYHFLALCGY